MSHYFNPTVIVPPLPSRDISKFEMFILKSFFEFDVQGSDLIYFYSHEGPFRTEEFKISDLKERLDDYVENGKGLSHNIWTWIKSTGVDDKFPFSIELDEEMITELLENIIERSSVVKRIDVVQSYMCDKMTMDGFGGKRISITSNYIDVIDTSDLSDEGIFEEDEVSTTPSDLLDAVVDLAYLAQGLHKCMNGFADAVRSVSGIAYPWPEMDIINKRFEDAQLDKLGLSDPNSSSKDVLYSNETLFDPELGVVEEVKINLKK